MVGDPFGYRVNSPFSKKITTSGTTNIVTGTGYLYSLMYNCTNAGTSWSFTIQDKSATPIVLYTIAALVVSTVPVVVVNVDAPIPILGGIDIITTGATPGAVGVWGNVSQN